MTMKRNVFKETFEALKHRPETIYQSNLMFNLKGNHLYEFYGGHGTGKTQLCLHLAARFSQNRKVLYLDTNNDEVTDIFSYIAELIGNLKEIASRQNCSLVMTNNATKNGTLPALGNF